MRQAAAEDPTFPSSDRAASLSRASPLLVGNPTTTDSISIPAHASAKADDPMGVISQCLGKFGILVCTTTAGL